MKYGKLTILNTEYRYSRTGVKMLSANCVCECGNIKTAWMVEIKRGHTKSCGCLKQYRVNKNYKKFFNTYNVWRSMVKRCTNNKDLAWHNYGGRGITVCKRWKNFDFFLEDMGEKPKGLSLDRTDNNKGYSKENCRWVNSAQQSRNRRNSMYYTHKDKKYFAIDFGKKLGLNRTTIYYRLHNNIPLEKSLRKASSEH